MLGKEEPFLTSRNSKDQAGKSKRRRVGFKQPFHIPFTFQLIDARTYFGFALSTVKGDALGNRTINSPIDFGRGVRSNSVRSVHNFLPLLGSSPSQLRWLWAGVIFRSLLLALQQPPHRESIERG
jgi:hypothetical protein